MMQGTWEENRHWCFQFGMMPISMLNSAKRNQMLSLASNKRRKNMFTCLKPIVDGWNLNQKYWTFGRKYLDNGGMFGWCPSGNVTVGWGANEPNLSLNKADCAQLLIENKLASLVNANCSTPAFFACEVRTFWQFKNRMELKKSLHISQGGTTPVPIAFPKYRTINCPVNVRNLHLGI
jgi:hypothetical protein